MGATRNTASTYSLPTQFFVILQRDAAAAATVKFWCEERIRLGKNQPGDPQITEALDWVKKIS